MWSDLLNVLVSVHALTSGVNLESILLHQDWTGMVGVCMSVIDRFVRARQFIRSLTIYNFYRKFTKTYIGFVTLAALIGFAYLLLFPLGVIFGAYQVYLNFHLPLDNHMMLITGIWSSVILFCAGITYSLVTLKFKDLEGIPLPVEKAQLIYNKIEEIQQLTRWPRINNVVLTRRFELNIVKTPVKYAPFWSKTTLAIGYPFLQTLSPESFDCALTRKILQYAKRRNVFINWLSFLRVTWEQYPESLKAQNRIGDRISYLFFRPYAWLYRAFALYVTQLDELQADALALNELNDQDMFRTVQAVRLIQKFLDEYYWPKLGGALQQAVSAPEKIKPYEHLPRTATQMMSSDKAVQWLKQFTLENDSKDKAEPSFRERMDMMGYRKVCSLQPYIKTAAEYYFGPANPKLVAHMNKLWAHHVRQELSRKKLSKRSREIDPGQQKLLVAF